jgi:hypothetical protein
MDKFISKKRRLEVELFSSQAQSQHEPESIDISTAGTANVDSSTVTVAGASCDYGNGGSAARTGNSSTSSSASATVGQSTPKVASACRNFRPEWVSSYAWLSFDEAQGACFCSTCKQANDLRLLQNARFVKEAFIDKGFSNWKHALERFGGHEKSECHRTAVMKMAAITSGTHVLSNLNKAKQDDMLKASSAYYGF